MQFLLYTSHALLPDTPAAHETILRSCRHNNANRNVTGFLHREGDYFIQYLEGDYDALDETLTRIRHDPRHENLTVLTEGPLTARRLPDWQMGFSDGRIIALSDVLTLPTNGQALVVDDPFDLIVLMVANSSFLRENALAA